MAWDFTADSEIQSELSKNLNTYADNYWSKVGDLYKNISDMGGAWIGDDYDMFKAGCDGYKTALEDLANSIRLYSVHFGKVEKGTEELASNLLTIIQTLTEFSGAVGEAEGTPGSGTAPSGSENTSGGWTSYEEAVADGHSEVMTQEEFERHKESGKSDVDQYETYQDYLQSEYDKANSGSNSQSGNETSQEKEPENKTGTGTEPEEDGDEGGAGAGSGDEPEKDLNEEAEEHRSDKEKPEHGGGSRSLDGSLPEDPNRNIYTSGDAVQINGHKFNVYGYVTGKDGTSVGIYEGTDGYLYYMNDKGDMKPVGANQTVTTPSYSPGGGIGLPGNYNTSAGKVKPSDIGNIRHGLSYVNTNELNIDGVIYSTKDVVSKGYSDRIVEADPYGPHNSYTTVTDGNVQEYKYTPISSAKHGDTVTLASHTGSSNVLAVPGNTEDLRKAVANQQPIKLIAGKTLKYDGYGSDNRNVVDYKKDTYFIYKGGSYYLADENGNVINSTPFDPSVLAGKGLGNDTVLK